ncbi:hypothetical protein C8J56DRAFT_888950 [Mycena floridula]|nr:hypothetical protein C8J56DRAFT_888950 [Mycena floridula]
MSGHECCRLTVIQALHALLVENITPCPFLRNFTHYRGGNQSHGSGHSLAGKVERVAGTVLGLSSLKAKGIQKEQEAKAAKVQSSELAETEMLKAEALMRKERAVAQGAHPDNRHLGSSNMPGATQ